METINAKNVRNSQMAMLLNNAEGMSIVFTDEQKEFIEQLKEHKNDGNCASVFVGTWAKYNEGLSLDGAWLNIETFSDSDEFNEFCKLLHNDENDPEFAILDYQNIPKHFDSEDVFNSDDLFEFFENYDEHQRDVICAYWDEIDASAEPKTIINEYYIGDYDSSADYSRQVEYEQVPKEYHYLIDMIPDDAFENYDNVVFADGHLFFNR